MSQDTNLAFGRYGKTKITGNQVAGTVFNTIRAHNGDADITFTSESGEVFANFILKDGKFDHDVYKDIVVNSGELLAWYSTKQN